MHARSACPTAALEWIQRLVSIDTVSRHSNLGLIELVRDTLAHHGIESHLSYHAAGGKANLFATIPAADGNRQGGIVLSGHTDVVPVDGQDWHTDPFKPVIQDGKLYGRGSCDMKGYIGTALALLPAMCAGKLQQPMHFALSYDEEVGCLGAPVLLAELGQRGIHPAGCIVGEPSLMQPVVAHKGVQLWRCAVHGKAAHSSLTPKGVNAIEYAALIIRKVREQADALRAGPLDAAFDVPFSTAQVGLVQGGIAANTVPEACNFTFDHRNLPGVDGAVFGQGITDYVEETVAPTMKAEDGAATIQIQQLATVPAFEADERAAVTRLARRLTKVEAIRKVAYGSEAGQFQEAGIPAVICGPGDIRQAHEANEFVTLEQLGLCHAFLQDVIAYLETARPAA